MNKLVFINNEQVVTDSVTVAGNFEKRHDNVMRDIENLKKDVLNFEEMFFEAIAILAELRHKIYKAAS